MSVATPPTELKASIIVPTVLVIGDRTRYYRPAPIERLKVESETPHQLRIEGRGKGQVRGHNVWQDKAYCIPSDKEWFEVLRRHDRFEEALDELGTYLLDLGSYAKKLAAAGGIKKAPNPLTPTVISCKDPETDEGSWGANSPWEVYPSHVYRHKALVHTPKMLRYWMEGEHWSGESITSQSDQFLCPDDAAWEQFQALRNAAIAASNHLQDYLKQLGTYQEAKQDGRYGSNGRAHPDRVDEPDSAETAIAGGIAPADEPPASNGSVAASQHIDGEIAGQTDERSLSAAFIALQDNGNSSEPIATSEPELQFNVGDRVELYRNERGEALPEAQRRRAEVVHVYSKDHLKARYRGERFPDKKDQAQRFRKLPDRVPLPYPTQPVETASRGEAVVVTAPDHPCYGETFTVHTVSIFGAFRDDSTFFYDEELGYRVDDEPLMQPIPPERDESDTEPTLLDRRQQLLTTIEAIRQEGPVAPVGAEWKRYRKTKTVGKGDTSFAHTDRDPAKAVTYPLDGGYYYTLWHRNAIFTNAQGKLVKSLHIGTRDAEVYQDWEQRFERRRKLKRLQNSLRQLERPFQSPL